MNLQIYNILMLFYAYGFLGWMWESIYSFVALRKWVNRGFLNGPVIPIYGFGALIMLFITSYCDGGIVHLFFVGALVASTLEYFTGAAIEKLFNVRYWDYSNFKFNINGHICLFASLGWGVFSVLLVHIVNPEVEKLIFSLPDNVNFSISIIFTIIFLTDTTLSVRNALDIKELLSKISENIDIANTLENKFSLLSENANSLLENARESVQRVRMETIKKADKYQEVLVSIRKSGKNRLSERINSARNATDEMFEFAIEKIDELSEEVKDLISKMPIENDNRIATDFSQNIEDLKLGLRKLQSNIGMMKNKKILRTIKTIKRNPFMISKPFKEAFKKIRDLFDNE